MKKVKAKNRFKIKVNKIAKRNQKDDKNNDDKNKC